MNKESAYKRLHKIVMKKQNCSTEEDFVSGMPMLTKQQRLSIYLDAYEYFCSVTEQGTNEGSTHSFCSFVFDRTKNYGDIGHLARRIIYSSFYLFPELYLCAEQDFIKEGEGSFNFWFPDYEQKTRTTALAFAIAMCN